ncbi:tRNA guanosine(34) transglycosylase Tgt [Candidatus Uhrbacteria bacterium]|nr:tRNA guanosine(34) transglycosylase Tgt [Candidatus Uhrbacteria bacterium]
MSFTVVQKSKQSRSRFGTLRTNHGLLDTPLFMPIATQGAVKGVGSEDMEALGASIVLANTYHLMLRPGTSVVRAAGGLHTFMNWHHPILTDSGGYQVFSLTKMRTVTEEGVTFRSPIDGAAHVLTPERSMEVQHILGSDMVMALDECTEYPVSLQRAQSSMELTTRWAARSKERHDKLGNHNLLFGIVQGSTYEHLRTQSAADLLTIGFDGYAIGGVSVGEPWHEKAAVLEWVEPLLPHDRPRYLMGVGQPEEVVAAVSRGIDMFDCVLPTRNARHGLLYVAKEHMYVSPDWHKGEFYETMRIENEAFKTDFLPIDPRCNCPTCRGRYSRAYLRHLFVINESLGQRLATLHNLFFYLDLMRRLREAIRAGSL